MTWTYDDTLSTDRDKVRLQVGDTDTDDELITNEGIDYVLSRYDDVDLATYKTAQIILAGPKMARAVDRQGTGFSASRSQKFQHLKDIVSQWRSAANLTAVGTLTGGSVSEKTSLESDSDYVPAAFEQGLHDNDQD